MLLLPWRLIVPGVLLLAFTFPTFISLGAVWSTDDYSHGYLVLGLTAVLVVSELRRASLSAPTPSWAGLACLFSLVLVTMAARVMTIDALALLAWPLSWIAALWAWTGWKNARRFVLPLGYLLVAIPVWDYFVEPLRRLTVGVVSMWIRVAGMPAFIEGNQIHVPSGTFEVLGGCAGLRYALVALALAGFVGLLNYQRWQSTVLLTVSALALVTLGNWLRVFTTVAVGVSPQGLVSSFVSDHHTLFGWIVFVLFISPLSLVHRRLQTHTEAGVAEVPAVGREGLMVPSGGRVAYVSCAVLGLAVWLTVMSTRLDLPREIAFQNPEIAGWTREADWEDARLPVFEGATVQDAAWYADGAARVGAYVVGFADQSLGREVVSMGNGPTGATGVVVARQTVAVQNVSGDTTPFLQLEISESGANRRLVWVGLRVAGSLTASDLAAKVLQLRGAIRGRHDAQVLVLTAVCRGGCDEARSYLSRFASAGAEPLYEHAERAVFAR